MEIIPELHKHYFKCLEIIGTCLIFLILKLQKYLSSSYVTLSSDHHHLAAILHYVESLSSTSDHIAKDFSFDISQPAARLTSTLLWNTVSERYCYLTFTNVVWNLVIEYTPPNGLEPRTSIQK